MSVVVVVASTMMTTTMVIMRNCNIYCADQLLKRIRGRPKKAERLPRLSRVAKFFFPTTSLRVII